MRGYITEELFPSPVFFSTFGGPVSEREERLFTLKIPIARDTMTEPGNHVKMKSQKQETDKVIAAAMPDKQVSASGGDLFIVDNSDSEWKVLRYLREWCEIARSLDVATGYFEIGSLLAMDGQWQKIERIRVLMGDEVSKRTKNALVEGIERHLREYTPFVIYAKALQEYFRGHEMTVTEWEQTQSKMYPVLDPYQKEGYHSLMKIAAQHGGAFLCDGVGLGKTFVGLMLIERLVVHDRKRVALFVPKSARHDVWERDIRRYLRYLGGDFSNLVIFNHTDLLRVGDFQYRLDRVKEMADVIVIDEAHHFRNPGVKGEPGEILTHYWRLYDLLQNSQGVKQIFMLTATPVNNRLRDFQHMIELFSRREPDHFKDAPLGIHSLSGHFRKLEKALEKMLEQPAEEVDISTNQAEAEKVLWSDDLFRALVVQRSRAYVKQSQEQHGAIRATFPQRDPKSPAVVELA
jgi:hypothetical protein